MWASLDLVEIVLLASLESIRPPWDHILARTVKEANFQRQRLLPQRSLVCHVLIIRFLRLAVTLLAHARATRGSQDLTELARRVLKANTSPQSDRPRAQTARKAHIRGA